MSPEVRSLVKLLPWMALLMAVLVACGGGSEPADDGAELLMDDLTENLRQDNAEHYAFGCVDPEGTLLSGDYSPDAIADDVDIEPEHAADSWTSETRGVVLGAAQQSIVIYDPESGPTHATEFERREVIVDGVSLICLVPESSE